MISSEIRAFIASVSTSVRAWSLLARNVWLYPLFLLGTTLNTFADPVAVDDERNMVLNSSLTLNLITNDFSDNGNAIAVSDVGNPANGTVSLNPDGSVLYTPEADFTGVDTFTYSLLETATDLNDTGLVTITVSASRLSTVFDSGNSLSFAQALDRACRNIRDIPSAELGEVRRTMLERCDALDILSLNDTGLTQRALAQIAPEETISFMRSSLGSSNTQSTSISQRMQTIKSGDNSLTFNGSRLLPTSSIGGSAGDDNSLPLGLFATLQYENNERDSSENEQGYKSSVSSLTLGADYRLSANYLLGAAIGFNQSGLDFQAQGGNLDTDLNNLFLYNSYSFKYLSIDAQIGYGSMSFSSKRNIAYQECVEGGCNVSEQARSKTKGKQLLASLNIQGESHRNAFSIYPFLRMDYTDSKIDAYGEQAAGGFSMLIGEQKAKQIMLSTGIQTTYAFRQDWGVIIPNASFSIYSDAGSKQDLVLGRFSFDTDPSNTFVLDNDGVDSNYYQFGLGTTALFTHGISAYFQYQQLVSYEYLSSWQVQAGFKYEF